MSAWKTLRSTVLVDAKYTRVRREEVRLPSGAIIDDFHVIESPTWAGVIACTDNKQLILVRQYRHGHQGTSLELPAGVIEPGEDLLAGARRELREETGFDSDDLTWLWTCRPEPSRHEQWAHFAFARNARPYSQQALDATEDISVELRPLSQLDDIVSEMVHGIHVAAVLLAARKGLFEQL